MLPDHRNSIQVFCARVIEYYKHRLCIDLHVFKRSQIVSYLLLAVRLFWFIQLLFNEQIISKIQIIEQNMFEIDQITVFTSEFFLSASILIPLTFNILILSLIVFSCIAYIYDYKAHQLSIILSLLAQSYNYLFFIPLMVMSSPSSSSFGLQIASSVITILLSKSFIFKSD